MSTKIYYGFRIRTTNLRLLIARCEEARKKLMPLANMQLNTFLGEDQTAVANWHEWQDRRKQVGRTGLSDPAVDTDFQVCIIPQYSYSLGIAYTEHRDWFAIWMSMTGIYEYGYWDNVDRPDGMSEARWRRRGRTWDKALGPYGIPGMVGVTFDIIPIAGPVPHNEQRRKPLPTP